MDDHFDISRVFEIGKFDITRLTCISFSESSHVAYQIKADDAGSNMVANILPTDTPSTQGMGSKGQTISFSESSTVAYQINGN